MPELHETPMGRKLIEGTLPEIARQLERIANVLESKKVPEQVRSAFEFYLNNGDSDSEIVKQLKQIWNK